MIGKQSRAEIVASLRYSNFSTPVMEEGSRRSGGENGGKQVDISVGDGMRMDVRN